MILLLSFWFHIAHAQAQQSTSCVSVKNNPKFKSIELKLNLDGNGKPDVIAIYDMGGESMEGACARRALIFDAPEKPGPPTEEQWLGASDFTDPNLQSEKHEYEKRTVGDRDLLFVSESIGNFQSQTYYSAEGGKLKKMLVFGHPQFDSQISENYDKKSHKLAVSIFDSGTLEVGGQPVDLDEKAIKLRCRVRELHVQVKYAWDAKAKAFRSVDEGCVMGQAID